MKESILNLLIGIHLSIVTRVILKEILLTLTESRKCYDVGDL